MRLGLCSEPAKLWATSQCIPLAKVYVATRLTLILSPALKRWAPPEAAGVV